MSMKNYVIMCWIDIILMLCWNYYFYDRLTVNDVIHFGSLYITSVMLLDFRYKYERMSYVA